MAEKLKPCPFCGGEAYLHKSVLFSIKCVVMCDSCGARTMEHTSSSIEDAKRNALASWNRRDGESDG